jgi:hypothetical protein
MVQLRGSSAQVQAAAPSNAHARYPAPTSCLHSISPAFPGPLPKAPGTDVIAQASRETLSTSGPLVNCRIRQRSGIYFAYVCYICVTSLTLR